MPTNTLEGAWAWPQKSSWVIWQGRCMWNTSGSLKCEVDTPYPISPKAAVKPVSLLDFCKSDTKKPHKWNNSFRYNDDHTKHFWLPKQSGFSTHQTPLVRPKWESMKQAQILDKGVCLLETITYPNLISMHNVRIRWARWRARTNYLCTTKATGVIS